MKLDEKSRAMKRLMEAMRPITDAEIAEMQSRQAPLMRNVADQMRNEAGMQNFRSFDEERIGGPRIDLGRYAGTYGGTIEAEPTRTLWQRMKRWFMRHNVELTGAARHEME